MIEKGINISGRIKIWKGDDLVVDKPNMVLYEGGDIVALAIAGEANSKITHFYVGYYSAAGVFVAPTISKADNRASFEAFTGNFGYLRLPLSVSPSFVADTNYDNNNSVFTTVVTTATPEAGAAFIPGTSQIYEVGLVCERSPNDKTKDLIFARANFNPITFVSSHNLTISWMIKIAV